MKDLLRIEQLSFKYPDYPELEFPELFTGLNLTVKEGDFRIVLGKPESGKTTLSRIVTGLIPRYTGGTVSGTVFLDGENIEGKPPYELTEKAGCVFQNPDEQIITTRCDTEITFPMESLGWTIEQMEKRLQKSLESTGISTLKTRNPATLSGGEKKKLLFAALFALDPALWILDETFEELDPFSVNTILTRIMEKKKTVLLFASKIPDFPDTLPVFYSVFSEGRLVHKEDISERDFQEILLKEGLVIPSTRRRIPLSHKENEKQKEELIRIENIHYAYKDNKNFSLTLDNLSLHEGEIISLVGRNGSGKSTLGKILSGLIIPDRGTIQIRKEKKMFPAEGKDLHGFTGFLFQNPDSQIFLSTIKEELTFNLHLTENEIEETIRLFSLPGKHVPPALMSYGARKRLQGAIYYLLDKKLYIIDEADSGLSVEDFSNIISSLMKEHAALVIITHNMALSRLFSERIYIMERGTILESIETHNFSHIQTYFKNEGL